MFKCKDCGSEYKEKPDYCDCGNNTFEEIKEEIVSVNNKVENTITQDKETDNTKQKSNNIEKSVKDDKISLIIFVICLIISFTILVFPVNTTVKTDITPGNESENTVSVPSINSIWDNSVPKVQPKKELPKTESVSSEKTVVKKNPKINEKTDKKALNTKPAAPNITKVTLTKNTNVKSKTTVKTEQKKQNDKITKPKTTAVPPQSQSSNTNNVKNEISLNSYKIGLRNKIASYIDFASVAGDGTCAVTFKLDANGKLVNRNFVQQSENTSLNDAVYNAMLAVPNYKTPPSTYKSNTLKLSVKFVSGNFEVSLD